MLSAIAGAAEQSDSPFIVDVWSNKEGLPQSSVISVIQTKDGYLWLGTQRGLVRFDGIHFTVFNEGNTLGLNSDTIITLFEDSQTNLWVGTETAGIVLVKNGTIKQIDTARHSREGRLVYAYEDANGIVWLYMADGRMSHYQNGKLEDDSSMISRDLVLRAAKIFVPNRSGGFWFIQTNRVQKLIGNKVERDLEINPWGINTPITSACEDLDGNLIVGTLGEGVFWYGADGKYQRISTDQKLSSAFVLSMWVDREGNLWVGTDGGGLNRIKKNVFDIFGKSQPLAAQSVSEDEHGGLWMAFNAFGGFRGASYWNTNSLQNFGVGPQSNVWSIIVDHKQQVWAGTGGDGLFRFQGDHFQPAIGAEILGHHIFALFEDRSGQIWAGTHDGLGCWNGSSWKIYTTNNGLSENIVRAIAEDAEGNLWVGTESQGLDFFKAGKFISYKSKNNELPGNGISSLYMDKDDVLWIGTSGHGLARFHKGKWTSYSTKDGLPSDYIGYIIEDAEGELWLGSNAGLIRIKKQSLNDFANGTTNSISCRTYVESDGLPTRECSSGSQPAACRARGGRLWLPTINGLVSVHPEELKRNLQPPVVMIESVLIENQQQKTNRLSSAWRQSIIVPPGREQLEIHYTGLNFSAPKEVRFRYRLEGRETRWTEAADTRVAYYSDVPPGHYYFHVKACNEDGVWNEAGSVLEIEVQPFFWQTRWFFFVVIACLLGLIVASVRYVSTQKLQRQLQWLKQQEALERERSRIARDLHDQLGANLTQVTLLSEMAEADKDSPAEIESHTQQISQTARETTRSLDEIVWAVNPSNDTLEGLINYACKYAQDYLATAQLRYRVDVPNDLPAIGIPPEVRHNVFLAFKEAVNNVVKHAQASEVWIRLRLQPDNFTLEIEDNGRGIGGLDTGAAQMRNGLRNMRRRMEDIHGEFSISSGTNGGTIVRLTIPFGKQAV
jgi:signal transduction histidine kinase/ligand-binding sensor domain-containing protein